MVIEYGQDYLRELYEDDRCHDKKHRFQPQVVKKYQKRVDILMAAVCKEDLFVFHSLGFEALHGDMEGLFSIRVDYHYRLEFSIREEWPEPIVTICTLQELSNHYQ